MYYVYGHNMSSGSALGGCKRKHGKTHGERTRRGQTFNGGFQCREDTIISNTSEWKYKGYRVLQ